MNASKVVSESAISGCNLHWDDVSLGTGKLWAFLFVKFPARRGFLVCELFLLAEFFLSVGFPCLWSSPAQVFCLESFTDCVVPPILALSTSYGSAVTFRIPLHRYLQPLTSHVYGVRRMIRYEIVPTKKAK